MSVCEWHLELATEITIRAYSATATLKQAIHAVTAPHENKSSNLPCPIL